MFSGDDHKVQEILRLHAAKLASSSITPTEAHVYLLHMEGDGTVKLDAEFVRYDAEDCKMAFDLDKRSVQWMMRQLTTYEPVKEYLAGVRFPNGEVLCHVFARKKRGAAHRRFA